MSFCSSENYLAFKFTMENMQNNFMAEFNHYNAQLEGETGHYHRTVLNQKLQN